MDETKPNGGRPMPWHDTATCEDATCKGPMVPAWDMPNGHGGPRDSRIACAACGLGRVGTSEDVEKTSRAHTAYALLDAGKIHGDRGCARCNGALPLDRVRLCSDCVEKDNAERQAVLFPGVA